MKELSLCLAYMWMVIIFYLLLKRHFFLAFKWDKGWMQNDSCALQLEHFQYNELIRRKKSVEDIFD